MHGSIELLSVVSLRNALKSRKERGRFPTMKRPGFFPQPLRKFRIPSLGPRILFLRRGPEQLGGAPSSAEPSEAAEPAAEPAAKAAPRPKAVLEMERTAQRVPY